MPTASFSRRCGCGATFTTTDPRERDCPDHRDPDTSGAAMHLDDPADDLPAAYRSRIDRRD